MRKTTQRAVHAFFRREAINLGNTVVDVDYFGNPRLFLFGNQIARIVDNVLEITNAGWASATTKERLNGLHGVQITQRKGVWYLNSKEWDGSWIKVS